MKYHWSKSRKGEKTVNLQCIMFDDKGFNKTYKCASLLEINFNDFSLAKLYQQQILHLKVVMKKIYNVPFSQEINLVPRAQVPFGQHQDMEIWNNQQACSQSPRVFCF